MVALEIMGFDGAGALCGTNPDVLPLRCVARYFIWHLTAAAVSDAVEILKMALAVRLLFPAM